MTAPNTHIPAGYRKTEVGVIPVDWRLLRFEDVMTGFASGATPSRARPEYFKGNIKWITSGELNYNVITDTAEKITEDAVRNTNLKVLSKGAFLIAITGLEAAGTRGSCGIVGEDATTNQSCMALFPKENELITKYLFYYYVLYADFFAFKYCQGTKQQSLTGKIVKNLPIPLPPTLAEQRAIAAALSDVDHLIAALGRLIAKKKAIKLGAMQELLTGRRRLPAFAKKNGYKETEVGVIPIDWETKELGKLGTFAKGKGIRKDQVLDHGISCVRYGELYTTHHDCIKFFNSHISRDVANQSQKLKYGDLLFAGSGETAEEIGKCVAFLGSEEAYAGGDIVILSPKEVDSLFLGYLLNSPAVVQQKASRGQGDAVVHISAKNLSEIIIPLPPTLAEQHAIAQILSDMDAEIEAIERKLEKYQAIKQGMMQELLTGKTRLV